MPEPRWYALRVKSHREDLVQRHLESKKCVTFVPFRTEKHKWSDRSKQIQIPLFAGYVFAHFVHPSTTLKVLKTPFVMHVVGSSGGPVPIEDSEIEALKRIVASGLPPVPVPYPCIGDRVEIVAGPLKGVQGVLVAAYPGLRHSLVVSLDLLQRAVSVAVDPSWVGPCPTERGRR